MTLNLGVKLCRGGTAMAFAIIWMAVALVA